MRLTADEVISGIVSFAIYVTVFGIVVSAIVIDLSRFVRNPNQFLTQECDGPSP